MGNYISADFLKQFKSLRILVIGDIMLDHYIWGDVHRISPEAPVPVVNVSRDTYTAGGAANVALNLSNLGVNTSIFGYLNPLDEAGTRLGSILSDNHIEVYNNAETFDASTIVKTRVLVRNQQLCRLDREDGRALYQSQSNLPDKLERLLLHADAVIISDYHKGVIDQTLLNLVAAHAKKRPELLVSVDPKPSSGLSYHNAGLLTPNRSEAWQLAGVAEGSDGKIGLQEVCKRIFDKYAPKVLVITLGADGMAICEHGILTEVLPAIAREVYDVSGAGDTVIATLTSALAAGANTREATAIANAAAGCVVGHMGTVPISLQELEQAILV